MSKAGRAHYDEDDYYDDDDGYYDDEEYYDEYDHIPQPKAAPKPSAKASAPAAKAPAASSPGKNTQPPSQAQRITTETPAQISKAKGGSSASALHHMTSPGTGKKDVAAQIEASEAERAVLMTVMPNVKAVVGTMASDASVVAALRRVNYDPDAAVNLLLSEDFAAEADDPSPAESGRVISASEAFATPASSGSIPAPSDQPKRKAGKLVVGGGATTPAKAGPSTSTGASVSPSAAASGAASPAVKSCVASPTSAAHVYFPTAEAKERSSVTDADGKRAISLVMAGHVDTGKSTVLGHLLVKLGHYTEREVANLAKRAKEIGRQSFHFAWILDQSEEERRRGVTIDSGVHSFETEHRRVSVLDAPGHKDYVASMISSAAQADIALFTVSAAKGEFESGLAHMTREHMSVIRTLGLQHVVVLVNKMDAVDYAEERYAEVVAKIKELARSMRFKEGVIAGFCPISGFQGVNLVRSPGDAAVAEMPWYTGPSLVDYIDKCEPAKRMLQYPLRFVVSDVAKQVVSGKVETGTVKVGDTCVVVPSGNKVTVKAIERPNVGSVQEAQAGMTADVTLTGDLLGVLAGDVVCPPKQRCPVASTFEAHVQFFDTLPKVVMPGTRMLLQMHATNTQVSVKRLLKKIDPATGTWSAAKFIKCLPAGSQGLILFELPRPMPLELADDNRALGRFILRLEDETVGGGLIRSLPTVSPGPVSPQPQNNA